MRIAMLADVYKPHTSGITNYIALNKRYLEASGHEVYVFTFGDEDYPDDEENIIRSPGLPLLDTGYFISMQYNRKARHLLRTMDVAHVHHPFLSGSLALRLCRPRGIPVIFTNHTRYDLYAQAYIPVVPDTVGEAALRAYMPSFCRACDLIISPSEGMHDVLRKFGVDVHVEVVPNGVELQPFKTQISAITRQELGFDPEDVILIYTGRLGPEKNLPFLLRSFNGAFQAFDHIRLLVVGDGSERDNLEDRVEYMGISDRVHFTGMVPYAELPRYLAVGDAFVTASVTEVHPLSVIEAMASGLPVLGIRSVGVGDIVVDGETGLLAAEADLAQFTAKMIRLVTDHDQRRRMGQAASLAADQYAIEHTCKLMETCYEQVVRSAEDRKRGLRARLTRFSDNWFSNR